MTVGPVKLTRARSVFRLLTPPGTPLFPSLETESERVLMSHATPMGRPNVLKSRVSSFSSLEFN